MYAMMEGDIASDDDVCIPYRADKAADLYEEEVEDWWDAITQNTRAT
jgi:hypothetical protein